MPHLISVEELASLDPFGAPERPVRIIDVRWRLDRPEGRVAYVAGHLPGAVYVDLEAELTRRGHPEEGRHPLPDVDELQRAARRWGLDDGDLVVAYDDNDGVAAARAWWLLRQRGVDVRVLDGGLRAWMLAGHPLQGGDHAPTPGAVTLSAADPGAVSIDGAARAPVEGFLVDARGPEQYRGRAAGLDPASGHIPGAINIPAVSHIASDGTFKPAATIRTTLAQHGIAAGDRVVLYCGSGIASAHSALAYALAGVEARVYAGSWSQWSRSGGRPVAVGPTPSDEIRGW